MFSQRFYLLVTTSFSIGHLAFVCPVLGQNVCCVTYDTISSHTDIVALGTAKSVDVFTVLVKISWPLHFLFWHSVSRQFILLTFVTQSPTEQKLYHSAEHVAWSYKHAIVEKNRTCVDCKSKDKIHNSTLPSTEFGRRNIICENPGGTRSSVSVQTDLSASPASGCCNSLPHLH